MKSNSQTVSYPDLNGSEQHLPLKKNKTQDDKADTSSETLDDETADAVDASKADTQIADELRQFTDKK